MHVFEDKPYEKMKRAKAKRKHQMAHEQKTPDGTDVLYFSAL